MSVPSSLKAGPFISRVLVKKRYLLFHVFIMWFAGLFIQLEMWAYWMMLYHEHFLYFMMFLPLLFFVMYITAVLTALLAAKILLIFVNAIHKPREGVFFRDASDKDYRFWSIRNTIKKFPAWLAHKFPFPFLDNICFKVFGVRTEYSNSLFEGWVDTEFVEFGKNVVVGQGSIVQSAVIIGHLFIIQKTRIDDNVRIGAHSIIMPGTRMGKNTILAAHSITTVGQELEEGWVYLGVPANKYKENAFFEDDLKEVLDQAIGDASAIRQKYEWLYTKRHDRDLSLMEKYEEMKEVKQREQQRLEKAGEILKKKQKRPSKAS